MDIMRNVKVELVDGQPRDWQVTISNNSGTRSTIITANSTKSAWAWADEWGQALRNAGEGNWQVKDVCVIDGQGA